MINISDKLTNQSLSVNYQQYWRSDIKMHNIAMVTDLLQKSSVDCQIFKERNKTLTCDGVNPKDYNPDFLTYDLYYKPTQKIQKDIISIFNTKFVISFTKLESMLDYNKFELLDVMDQMIANNTIIYNRWGLPCYLRYGHNGMYYITMNIFDYGTADSYYTEFIKNNPLPIHQDKIIDIIFAHECKNILTVLNTRVKEDKDISEIFHSFNLSIQEFMLQGSLRPNKFPEFSTWVKTELKHAFTGDNIVFLKNLKDKKHPIKKWDGQWKVSSDNIDTISGQEIYDTYVTGNKFLGVVKGKSFKLRDIGYPIVQAPNQDNRKKLLGKECMSWKLDPILAYFKIEKPKTGKTQRLLCNKIKDKLKENNLIIDHLQNTALNTYMNAQNMIFLPS